MKGSDLVQANIIPNQQRFFDIDKSGLRQYWELISWQGLIKAKAKSLLPYLPAIDTILFNICTEEAKSIIELARCATIVMKKNDKNRLEKSNLRKSKQVKLKRRKRRRKRKKAVVLNGMKILSHEKQFSKTLFYERRRRKRLEKLLWEMILAEEPSIRVRRVRRNIEQPTPFIDSLAALQEHYRKSGIVKSYFDLIEQENSKLYKKMKLGITIEKRNRMDGFEESMEEVIEAINSFTGANDSSVSLLSPRLFSILPGTNSGSLFPPDILSFHDKGLISVPKLIEIITGNEVRQIALLEWVLRLSGAGKSLTKIMTDKAQDIEETASYNYPLVQRMSRNDYNWLQAKKTFTKRQQDDLKNYGFTYFTNEQQNLVFKEIGYESKNNFTSRREQELWLESKIRDIAAMEMLHQHRRVKRQEGAADEGFTTLVPVAFANMVNEGVAIEAITLSPQAFVSEIQSPEAISAYTLSPRAYLAAILSPIALVSRILSPDAFLVEILSPRTFSPYILSPRAFLVEILTPRAFEPHIVSPDVMVIDILSPAGLSPQVLSPEMGAIIILSPKFLSPRMASAEKFLVEILSPHILGGPHTSHDDTVLAIGGGEHAHEHVLGDEGSAAHQEDIHLHQGALEGQRGEPGSYNPFGFTLVPTIPPKDDFFQLNDLINPTIPPDGDVLGFKYLKNYKLPTFNDLDPSKLRRLQGVTLPTNFLG